MKKTVKKYILRAALALALAGALFAGWKALFYGRGPAQTRSLPERVELSYEAAMADGLISPEEVAVHYAPEVRAAVNLWISASGKGDFIAAVDYDGDTDAGNNWENMTAFPLEAVVYWSVQETDTRYFVGYDFYHPRDDAEIWLDRHENDFEGIMLAIPKCEGAFLAPVCMYTQGHGGVFFYGQDLKLTAGSRGGAPLALEGDRPVIYITPNGTLSSAGHSIESWLGRSRYWSVGDSGIRYYHGGEAMVPGSFNGPYEDNPCSYRLEPLGSLWARRNGPYGKGNLFASYGAFYGDNYGKNAANPPWAWRNKTGFGFGGSFLSDPAWTFSRALEGWALSPEYSSNPFADWIVTVKSVTAPEGKRVVSLRLFGGEWEISAPDWWNLGEDGSVEIAGEGRQSLWIAAPRDTLWRMEAVDEAGLAVPEAQIEWEALLLPEEQP